MRTAILLLASMLSFQPNYALVKGNVFTEDGRTFSGAKVTIFRTDVDAKRQKKSRQEAYSDNNGEFAFRMDIGPAKFHVTGEAKGFKTVEKEIEVSGNERTDISVVLKK